jgi:glucokinase
MKMRYAVGIDIGGTKISVGIVSSKGEIVGNIIKFPTLAYRPKELIIKDIIDNIRNVVHYSGISLNMIDGIGIGSPGPLDSEKGIILNPRNLKTLHNFNIRKAIMSRLKKNVLVNNDANVFVLGESCFGAGREYKIVFGVTLGTGLGSGLVIDKKIYMGATGTACEIWFSCFKDGVIEDYVSGEGIRKIYSEIARKPAPEPKEIADLAKKGDVYALDAWNEFGKYLGIILSYVVNIIDPELIVIGGSLSKVYNFFYKEMNNNLRKHITPVPRKRLKIRLAKLGEKAPIIGAASLILFDKN